MTDLALYTAANIHALEWLGGGCCNACDRIDGAIVRTGQNFPSVNVPAAPAHEGCSCEIAPVDAEFRTWVTTIRNP